ncbi:MAG: hypothetical protein KDJ99_30335 [Candidatus Competibacteraceae bacterium]|nr:hypothetical protein [Candidatus Competibacteraceae bacterium]
MQERNFLSNILKTSTAEKLACGYNTEKILIILILMVFSTSIGHAMEVLKFGIGLNAANGEDLGKNAYLVSHEFSHQDSFQASFVFNHGSAFSTSCGYLGHDRYLVLAGDNYTGDPAQITLACAKLKLRFLLTTPHRNAVLTVRRLGSESFSLRVNNGAAQTFTGAGETTYKIHSIPLGDLPKGTNEVELSYIQDEQNSGFRIDSISVDAIPTNPSLNLTLTSPQTGTVLKPGDSIEILAILENTGDVALPHTQLSGQADQSGILQCNPTVSQGSIASCDAGAFTANLGTLSGSATVQASVILPATLTTDQTYCFSGTAQSDYTAPITEAICFEVEATKPCEHRDARSWYISANGSDESGNGTVQFPYREIQAVFEHIDFCAGLDRIEVIGSGVFQGFQTPFSGIQLIGEQHPTFVCPAGQNAVIEVLHDDTELSGITVDADGVCLFQIEVDGASNVDIYDVSGKNSRVDGLRIHNDAQNIIVEDSIFTACNLDLSKNGIDKRGRCVHVGTYADPTDGTGSIDMNQVTLDAEGGWQCLQVWGDNATGHLAMTNISCRGASYNNGSLSMQGVPFSLIDGCRVFDNPGASTPPVALRVGQGSTGSIVRNCDFPHGTLKTLEPLLERCGNTILGVEDPACQ